MNQWIEIIIFLIGWAVLAGAGWWLYLKVLHVEQKHESVLRDIRDTGDQK